MRLRLTLGSIDQYQANSLTGLPRQSCPACRSSGSGHHSAAASRRPLICFFCLCIGCKAHHSLINGVNLECRNEYPASACGGAWPAPRHLLRSASHRALAAAALCFITEPCRGFDRGMRSSPATRTGMHNRNAHLPPAVPRCAASSKPKFAAYHLICRLGRPLTPASIASRSHGGHLWRLRGGCVGLLKTNRGAEGGHAAASGW